MHPDWTPTGDEDAGMCPECEAEPRDPPCYRCRGTGRTDVGDGAEPDPRVKRLEAAARSLEETLCPRCRRRAHKRERSPRIFCDRCGYRGDGNDTTAFDEDAVKNDPRILEG